MNFVLHIIDVFGTFVFALSGAIIGVKEHYDIFGVFVIALVTAVGGGIIRDICISAMPPAGLVTIDYLAGVLIAILIVAFFQKIILSYEKAVNFFDAIGLGFFSAFGANKAYLYTGNIQISIMLGCASAIGGGLLRDILTNRKPIVFNQELYASAAITGSSIELLGSTSIINSKLSIWLAILTATTIRMLAIKYNITLPSIKQRQT